MNQHNHAEDNYLSSSQLVVDNDGANRQNSPQRGFTLPQPVYTYNIAQNKYKEAQVQLKRKNAYTPELPMISAHTLYRNEAEKRKAIQQKQKEASDFDQYKKQMNRKLVTPEQLKYKRYNTQYLTSERYRACIEPFRLNIGYK